MIVNREAVAAEVSAAVGQALDWARGADDDLADETEVVDRIVALVAPDPRLDAIRALHVERTNSNNSYTWCMECTRKWPCATVRALDGGA